MKPLTTRNLVAIRSHMYGTRHLTAGEEYEAPLRDAALLVVGKKARFQKRKEAADLPEPEKPPPIEAQSGIDALRARARTLGIDVDGRWGTARLQYEIGQAEGK